MADYTLINMLDVENKAQEGGSTTDVRFARTPLQTQHIGVSRMRYAPGKRSQRGHTHREQEEVYVVVAGSGQAKLDDEIHELKQWDVLRVAPGTYRGFAGGPDGLDLIAIGSDRPEGGDGESSDDDWWGD